MRAVQCMQVRHTDRRPVSDEPVPDDSLSAIAAAAVQEGARLEVLDRDQVLQLAASASQAATVEAEDSRLREELEYWTSRAGGTGLTPEVLPEQPAQTTVPGRDFGRAGTLPVGPGHDRAASYAVRSRCRPPGRPCASCSPGSATRTSAWREQVVDTSAVSGDAA
ncbi:hypothetical protein [Verrucosispora sioxanthis]|uniref:hypothetical protein n=1 Tax=Verrucosispora sioxanthis TaxID=2499994 RepID=UPI00403A3CC2